MSTRARIAIVFGTRPEAIKLAPIVHELQASPHLEPLVIVTGQHREMLDPLLAFFGIHVDADLDLLRQGQSLTDLTGRALSGLATAYDELQPDLVVVQGDTTTTMSAALAGFYARTPVAHVEAGLRTHDRWSPYPEEVNRRITTQLSALHLAPTELSRRNLLAENVDPRHVLVTGNSVIDALLWAVERRSGYGDERLEDLDASGRRLLLVTTHRRESWGEPMRNLAEAVARLATERPDLGVVVPMHRNPIVRDVLEPALSAIPNVVLCEPLSYGPFSRLVARADVILTDSGGLQEEGPSLGKPVLVARENTERPEAIDAGTARLVGTDTDVVVDSVSRLLDDATAYAEMAHAVNPYGDGHAASRSRHAIEVFLGLADGPVDEFVPQEALQP